MEQLFDTIFAQWGAVGVVFAIAAYIIIDNIKNRKSTKISESKLDDIKENLISVKSEIPTINIKMEYL